MIEGVEGLRRSVAGVNPRLVEMMVRWRENADGESTRSDVGRDVE
jgi:hypothetical protein